MKTLLVFSLTALLTGCAGLPVINTAPGQANTGPVRGLGPSNFAAVVNRIEPVAEATCRQKAPSANCDFDIFVDARAGLAPNAYQSVNESGRPQIGFTSALISSVHNDDELAFILGHETAHHISGHLAKTQETALAGAVLGGLLATIAGGSVSDIDMAQNLGGNVGARAYSKDFELEADRLGTVIAYRGGYDPVLGAQYFARIPDPGDQFLGTHPPNSDRIRVVRITMAGLN